MYKYLYTLGMIIGFMAVLWCGHFSKHMLASSIGIVLGCLINLVVLIIQEHKEKNEFEKIIQEMQEQIRNQIENSNQNIKRIKE